MAERIDPIAAIRAEVDEMLKMLEYEGILLDYYLRHPECLGNFIYRMLKYGILSVSRVADIRECLYNQQIAEFYEENTKK